MNYENIIKQAEIHYMAHEDSQTIECATKAIDLDNSKIDGYYWRALASIRTRASENLKADLDAILAQPPCSAFHFVCLGFAYFFKKELELVVTTCSEALQQNDSIKEAYYYRAMAYGDLNKFELSLADCNKAIELDPRYAVAYNTRGIIYFNMEKYDLEIKDYDKAIEIDPKYAVAYNNRGSAYSNMNKYDLAIEDYGKAIENDPKYAAAYNNRGNAYYYMKKYDLAIKDYHKAIELDPKYAAVNNNRLDAYQMTPFVRIRNNREYMNMLKNNISKVVPFLGAGASIPYGYSTWKDLLLKLLDTCCRVQEEVSADDQEKIAKYINSGHYVYAASEMDKIFANLSSTACNVIARIAQRNPISEANKGVLGEYIHLFPTRTYLTTNYDQVIESLLRLRFKDVNKVIATKPSSESFALRLSNSNPSENPTVYYLHGIFIERDIILSDIHYDDHYGSKGDIKSSLRRDLPKKLRKLHNDYTFLYIGCSLSIKEDRILKLLREFYRNLQVFPYSYAFLNITTVTGEKIPMAEWESLDAEKRKQLETKLDEKEDELENMNVRVIWYYATTAEERELAQKILFEYILGEERQKWESEQERRKQESIKNSEEIKRIEKQQIEWEQAFENLPCGKDADIPNSQWLQIREFLRSEILTRPGTPEKYEIKFPMYKVGGGLYQISLVSENGAFYLSDNGTTYAELDKIFELKEPDVIKNLIAILRQYNCRPQQNTNAFIIDCTLQDIHIKMSYLIQAISFMLNMKIFYI